LHDHRLTTCCAIGPSAPLSDRLLIRFIGDVSLIPSSASAIGAFPVSATERFARSGPSTKTLSRSHVRAIEFCWARLGPGVDSATHAGVRTTSPASSYLSLAT